MKNYNKFIYAIMFSFVCYGCPKMDYKNIFTFQNNYSKDLFIILADRPYSDGSGIYPDTTLNIDKKWGRIVSADNLMRYDYYIHSNKDTLCLFIFVSDTVAKYSWEEIKAGYKILQRYDLSSNDFERFMEIFYPPNEAMKDMKMYPPYGE
jgi:hypothetical protein